MLNKATKLGGKVRERNKERKGVNNCVFHSKESTDAVKMQCIV